MDNLEKLLAEALMDEYLAHANYTRVIEKFGNRMPFANIVMAEQRHVSALIPLFLKYGFQVPADPYVGRVEVPATFVACCQLGINGEIRNIEMYDRLMAQTNLPDVLQVFSWLRRASLVNHLPAFQRCASMQSFQTPLTTQPSPAMAAVSPEFAPASSDQTMSRMQGANGKSEDAEDDTLLAGLAAGALALFALTVAIKFRAD
ncbi:hypothetical protein L3Q72_17445 [Vibrio sp. JC009]|uniref:ferritin-like domain-containing protein n=1 Tax=Vibrio sp. JC009 TaxID=2912314 RepID=UPI0023B0E81F|nr:hypothetical protein [Vibrio sp. JC009]WED24660.1 hypothetical protein L3Q72_17445 [Vibrio sp. JC009]